MRLDGFHVIHHPEYGIFLGEEEPPPEYVHLPAAWQIWSTSPNLFLSAPAYRNADEVRAKTTFLHEGWSLQPVAVDLLMYGEVYASMLMCVEAGLEPWVGAPEYQSTCYVRTPNSDPFYGAIAAQLSRYRRDMTIKINPVSAGLCWSVCPADMTKTREALIVRIREGDGAYRN